MTSQPARIGKARLDTTRTVTNRHPMRGASHAMMRWMPKSDHEVMYATRGPSAIPELAITTRSGTLTIGPPGVMTPAREARAMARRPDCRPKYRATVCCGMIT